MVTFDGNTKHVHGNGVTERWRRIRHVHTVYRSLSLYVLYDEEDILERCAALGDSYVASSESDDSAYYL